MHVRLLKQGLPRQRAVGITGQAVMLVLNRLLLRCLVQRMVQAQEQRLSSMIKDMVDGQGDQHWSAVMR